MADGKGGWIITRGISLRDAAEWVGFKIEKLNEFSATTRKEFKSKIVTSIINDLDFEWEEQRPPNFSNSLGQVKGGIYVLCLDGGLCVNYLRGNSRVLYIGKGQIRQRIKSHLEHKLVDFFLQIPGIQFRVYMTEPKKAGRGGANYFHDVEHDLLEEFSSLYGGQNGEKRWPIFNKNAGRSHSNNHKHKADWKLPLKNTRTRYVWALSPSTLKRQPKLQD